MITILPYQPDWPAHYAREAAALTALVPAFCRIEHIGSTAVPGLAAKPVIDIMAAVPDLAQGQAALLDLARRGYLLVDVGMRHRLFLQRTDDPAVNLHIVALATWDTRKERLMRDALIADAKAMADYAALKHALAVTHADDLAAYTRAKTAFVQDLMDRVHDRLGLPRVDVWED